LKTTAGGPGIMTAATTAPFVFEMTKTIHTWNTRSCPSILRSITRTSWTASQSRHGFGLSDLYEGMVNLESVWGSHDMFTLLFLAWLAFAFYVFGMRQVLMEKYSCFTWHIWVVQYFNLRLLALLHRNGDGTMQILVSWSGGLAPQHTSVNVSSAFVWWKYNSKVPFCYPNLRRNAIDGKLSTEKTSC
jgi:hypothetical protein